MKLAVSTLGCPDWKFGDILAAAKDLGLDGLELRGIEREIYLPRSGVFSEENLPKVRAKLEKRGIDVPMLTTGVCLAGDETAAIAEAGDYLQLAGQLGARYIRLMPTDKPHPEGEIDLAGVAKTYKKICRMAENFGVIPLIETNGELAQSAKMRDVMEQASCKNGGVLWDIHHPYRFFGETPQYTAETLAPWIKYVHVKDSVMQGGAVKYKMMGHGDVPVAEALNALKAADYDGFVTLEWVKRWEPNLEEPGIVFAHYKNYMDTVFAEHFAKA